MLTVATLAFGQAADENRSRPFAPGACGPVDPSYIRVAEETGGIPFFFQRSEVNKAVKFMAISSGENSVTLLWATGSLQSSVREFSVPLDSSLEHVVFVLSTDNHATSMDVLAPSGRRLVPAEADITDLTCGRYVILKNPPAGLYRIRIQGEGRYWASVKGKSDLFLHGVRFVEPGGRPGHEGFFPIAGQPLLGKPATLEASVSGPAKDVRFALVSVGGEPIKPIKMQAVNTDGDDQEFGGTFDLPSSPFRIKFAGTDRNGFPFQRFFEAAFRPTTLALSLIQAPETFLAGNTATFAYKLSNLGNPGTFRVIAVCSRGFSSHVEPSEITLAAEGTAKLAVSVTVPPEAQPFTGFDLTVTVSSRADAAVSNGISQHLSVSPDRR